MRVLGAAISMAAASLAVASAIGLPAPTGNAYRPPIKKRRAPQRRGAFKPGQLLKASPARSSTIRKFQRSGRPGVVQPHRADLYLNSHARRMKALDKALAQRDARAAR